jgi:hypothetical protein
MAKSAFSEDPSGFRGGSWWRRVLELGGSRSPRLPHRICAMHCDGVDCSKDEVLLEEWRKKVRE